jgi:hypothetical protein
MLDFASLGLGFIVALILIGVAYLLGLIPQKECPQQVCPQQTCPPPDCPGTRFITDFSIIDPKDASSGHVTDKSYGFVNDIINSGMQWFPSAVRSEYEVNVLFNDFYTIKGFSYVSNGDGRDPAAITVYDGKTPDTPIYQSDIPFAQGTKLIKVEFKPLKTNKLRIVWSDKYSQGTKYRGQNAMVIRGPFVVYV